MDIKKYNTDHLSFSLHRSLIPGRTNCCQLVIQYDCECLYNGEFDNEKHVEEFLEKYYNIFVKKAELIRSKLYAYKQVLCRDLEEDLEYIL